jgi:hypothetical protein
VTQVDRPAAGAEAQLREAVALSRLAGAVGGESLALLRLAETILARGDTAGAHRLLAESLELSGLLCPGAFRRSFEEGLGKGGSLRSSDSQSS